jgi:DNA-directed RNA polymerase specialized sigma24 family protein
MFKSFFAVEQEKDSPLLRSREELWRFLVWMAMCKVANTAHRHQSLCRDVRREQPLRPPELPDSGLAGWIGELQERQGLTAEQIAISREEFDRLLRQLPHDLQQIFIWKLESYSNSEIGKMINRTERTVELKMKIIRKTLEQLPRSSDSSKLG